MDRRKSLKSIVLGSVATGLLANGCKTENHETLPIKKAVHDPVKWRTEYENQELADIKGEGSFFNEYQKDTMTVLCDMILPPSDQFKGASDANVVDFIDFMVRDYDSESMQTTLLGGLMWLDREANIKYGTGFKMASDAQRKSILDGIAFYDPEVSERDRPFEVNFFALVRNLTMTGFYTSKVGIEELGYKGNMPNVWDGVPQDVLDQHGVSYEPEWLAKCVDQSKRNVIAKWDDNGNLIS